MMIDPWTRRRVARFARAARARGVRVVGRDLVFAARSQRSLPDSAAGSLARSRSVNASQPSAPPVAPVPGTGWVQATASAPSAREPEGIVAASSGAAVPVAAATATVLASPPLVLRRPSLRVLGSRATDRVAATPLRAPAPIAPVTDSAPRSALTARNGDYFGCVLRDPGASNIGFKSEPRVWRCCAVEPASCSCC